MLSHLRRAAPLLLLVCGSGWWAWSSARAALAESALDWSGRMLELPSVWHNAAPRELLLNGARVDLASGSSDLALPRLLDRLEASCRSRSRVAPAALRARFELVRHGLLDGVLRLESERAGLIACLDLGPEPVGSAGVLARLSRFGHSGDLADIGAIRVVRAEAREAGSFFVAVSSVGSLPLTKMFPPAGDAPGEDLTALPRPASARRLLTMMQLGREPVIEVYESTLPFAQNGPSYRATLRESGFELLSESHASASLSGLYLKGGRPFLIVVLAREQRTLFALSALAGGRSAVSRTNPATLGALSPITTAR